MTNDTIEATGTTQTGGAAQQAPVHGSVTWWEVPVPDLAMAKRFYTAVFGWTYQDFGDDYAAILVDGQMIGGLSGGAADVADGVRIYVTASDLEATLATVEDNGGAVLSTRTEIGGDMGWWAAIADPQGRAVGVWTGSPAA